jgi:circadian clock protein KaiB
MSTLHQIDIPANQLSEVLVVFRLYIAGTAPNSLKAKANLDELCNQYLKDRYELEIVDVLIDTSRAVRDRVFVTPMLVKVSPAPAQYFIGDLSETDSVLLALGIVNRP